MLDLNVFCRNTLNCFYRVQDPEDLSAQTLDAIFTRLEEDVLMFVKEQLRSFHRLLSSEHPEKSSERGSEREERSKEAVLNITMDFLSRMDLEPLAERLRKQSAASVRSRELKTHLQQRFSQVFEGVAKAGSPAPLRQIYTELYITEGGASEVNQEHEVSHIETASWKPTERTITCEEMFKQQPIRAQGVESEQPIRAKAVESEQPIRAKAVECEQPIRAKAVECEQPIRAKGVESEQPIRGKGVESEQPIRVKVVESEQPMRAKGMESEQPIRAKGMESEQPIRAQAVESEQPIRAVLTKGVAGVGKTVLTQKLSLDWAEDKAHQDVQLLLPFTFRELNVLKDRSFSLEELVHHFFSQTKGLHSFKDLQLLFILDGLDECRLPLDFSRTRVLTEQTESASVEELLVNLIRGSLLPSARLWITTCPAATNQIPAECVSMVTEVRGFRDPQKEQYFRNRFTDEEQATAVISHIKSVRSLFIMSYIPVFCWILSVVLQKLLEQTEKPKLPKTLTEMYIHFLVVQAKVKNIKYHEGFGTDVHWTPQTREMVLSLGKLAFEQLQKGNLIFYESDVKECGLDAAQIARYSGVFTQVFREEQGLYQEKVYCFIHLTVQEFLAALYVHETFFSSGKNLLSPAHSSKSSGSTSTTASERSSKKSELTKRKHQQTVSHFVEDTEAFYRSAVDRALQSPNGHLDLFLRFLLGLSLPTNQWLLKGLLTQTGMSVTGWRLLIKQERVEYIRQKLDNVDLSAERSLNLLHCLNELEDRSLVEQVQKLMSEGGLSDRDMSPAQWSAMSYILLSSNSDLEEFDLRKYCPQRKVFWGCCRSSKPPPKPL
uniref:NACHT domain-containing protein n=1 Tax=Neogobius melanostomus TaxID=47308 RepID=A0A8C6UJ95_9GOBI